MNLLLGESCCSSSNQSQSTSDIRTSSQSLDHKQSQTSRKKLSLFINKLQILSPISDKSHEQTSGSTPSSNSSHSKSDRASLKNKTFGESGNTQKENFNLSLNFNSQVDNEPKSKKSPVSQYFKSPLTPDIQQYLNVPWDVPKLKNKFRNKRNSLMGQSSCFDLSQKKKKSPDVEVRKNNLLKWLIKLTNELFN